MFGSDWPVCRAGCSYAQWLGTVQELCGGLSAAERESVLGGTARQAYGLDTRLRGSAGRGARGARDGSGRPAFHAGRDSGGEP
jgi:hypothetical protein